MIWIFKYSFHFTTNKEQTIAYWARLLITYFSEIILLNSHTSLRSHVKNSCFVFHQGFQTPRNNKSTRPLSSVSRCLEPLMKHSHSFLTYYLTDRTRTYSSPMKEIEENGKIPFLDCLVTPDNNRLRTTIYRKPTHTDRLPDQSSYNPISHKATTIWTLTRRAQLVYDSPDSLQVETDYP